MQGVRALLGASKKVEPLSNFDIEKAGRAIPHFRGVFSRNTLPSKIPRKECGVVNLDSSCGEGTHWVAYYKDGHTVCYFDSFGLDPPKELVEYLGFPIQVQTFQLQAPEEVICGHLCLHALCELAAGKAFKDVVLYIAEQRL